MKINYASHLDHGLTPAQLEYLAQHFMMRDSFFIETIVLPENLGTAPCGLYGPIMGDDAVAEVSTIRETRGGRRNASRMVMRPFREVREVTVIAGPQDSHPCVLWTAFGGPLTPKEPGDPTLEDNKCAESEAFWRQHALATGKPPAAADCERCLYGKAAVFVGGKEVCATCKDAEENEQEMAHQERRHMDGG